eukprot:12490768-Prorocentrum_lima.AAC.1
MGEKAKTGPLVGGEVVVLKRDLLMLQQYFSMMRGAMASELAVLEGAVPNAKNYWTWEQRWL